MKRSRAGGFTLVEVIVALTLMSALMLGLLSAMGTLGATAEKLERRVELGGERRLVTSFLRTTLSQAPKSLVFQAPQGDKRHFFVGTPTGLSWLGNMPARHGTGGLHHLRLFLLAESGASTLILQYTPFVGVDRVPDWATASTYRLVERVTQFGLAYESRATTAAPTPMWHEAWDGIADLPGRVRVDLAVDGLTWAPLWVVVRSPDVRGGVRIVHGPAE